MTTLLNQLKSIIDSVSLAEIFADAMRETDDPYGLLLKAQELTQTVYVKRLGEVVLVFVGFDDASVFMATIQSDDDSDRWTGSVFPNAESFASYIQTQGQSPPGAESLWESLPLEAREMFVDLVTHVRDAIYVPGEAGHA